MEAGRNKGIIIKGRVQKGHWWDIGGTLVRQIYLARYIKRIHFQLFIAK